MRVALSFLALLFCVSGNVWAGPVQISLEAYFQGLLTDDGMDVEDGAGQVLEIGGAPPNIRGSLRLVTGPVLAVEADSEFLTTYSLSSGFWSFDAKWLEPDGSTAVGSFTAPVFGFDFNVSEREGWPWPSYGSAQGGFGPGRFDARLAKLLGVRRNTLGGYFNMDVDVYDPNDLRFGPINREIGTNSTIFRINAVAVPEPSALVLMILGVGGAALARKRTRTGQLTESSGASLEP